jgi:hypothetical protein
MPTLDEAKTDATRERRTEQAIEWIAQGRGRNWKYEKCRIPNLAADAHS